MLVVVVLTWSTTIGIIIAVIATSTKKTLFSAKLAAPLRLADSVSHEIATALFDGRISPGEALPSEGEIARDFGVSKPIAREALRQLAAAGLISTQQGKLARAKAMNGEPFERIYGYAVRSSLERLREANEMRRVIETGIARLAAQRRDRTGLTVMERALVDMQRALGDPDAFTEADILFHLGIALATGNTMIRVQMEGLRSVQREVSELFSRRADRTEADWNATIERHRAIYQAIADGNAEDAERRVMIHFEAADVASLEVAQKLRDQKLREKTEHRE
jgi:GntR family transcriptional repressor for pyruvate dehydrogenase complex